MQAKQFSKGEALRFGLDTMKGNLGFFIGLLIVAWLVAAVPSLLGGLAREDAPALGFVLEVGGWVLSLIISMGMIRIALRLCDTGEREFADLFSQYRLFFKALLAAILYGLIVLGGIVLLVVPGIIWGVKLQFCLYLVVDRRLGPVEALRASSAVTQGVKWHLFLFGLLLLAINLLGVLCLGIGLFATVPTTMVATAFVYRKLLAQTESLQVSETATDETNA
jgi:uncharacterized membrane protein